LSESYIEQFKGIKAGPLIQFIKYGISGGLATITHIIVFHILAWKIFPALQRDDLFVSLLGLSYQEVDIATRSFNSMLSNSAAFICSNTVAYIVNIYWVFKPGRHNKLIEISLFYLVSGISVVIGTILMGFLISYYNMQTTYAFTSNLFTAVLINYAMRKFYIFKG
jgi:putative flippase GtrA